LKCVRRYENLLRIAALSLLAVALFSCASQNRKTLAYSNPYARSSQIIEILDYQGRADGVEMPEWLSLYTSGGIPALEKQREFTRYYLFIAEQSSPNLDTLRQWANNFRVERDFPRLVFLRAYRRLTRNLSITPDELYGSFFEMMMKHTAAQGWPQAQKYAETWALVNRRPVNQGEPASAETLPAIDGEPPETSADSTVYIYFILSMIEKTEIENNMKALMNDVAIDKTFNRDQVQAINSIKSNFFNGF
jgi:hypothetical protein